MKGGVAGAAAGDAAGAHVARGGESDAPFSTRVVIALVVIGALAFAAYVVLSAYADDLRQTSDGGPHALSTSAVGFAGVVDLLERRGAPVVIRRGATGTQARDSLLVLTPRFAFSDDDLDALDRNAPTLIVLPKWFAPPHPTVPGWVSYGGLLADTSVARVAAIDGVKVKVRRREGETTPHLVAQSAKGQHAAPATLGVIEAFQTLRGAGITPHITDDDGGIVLGQIEGTQILVLSDPDLLNTQGVGDPATAYVGVRILESLSGAGRPIAFDVTLHGFERSRNILKLAFEPPFLPAVLCALFAAGIMAWHAAMRFGPPARRGRVFAFGKRALIDNSAGLFRMTRREARLSGRYADLTRRLAVDAVAARARLSRDDQVEMLDRLSASGRLDHTYSDLARAAGNAEDRAGLVDAARALFAWRREITREHR